MIWLQIAGIKLTIEKTSSQQQTPTQPASHPSAMQTII
jgi:hypothetical protein